MHNNTVQPEVSLLFLSSFQEDSAILNFLSYKFFIFRKLFFAIYMHVCVLSHFSRVQLFVTVWTVAHLAPLSMGFSRQDTGVIPPWDLPDPGIKPASLMSPALASGFFTTSTTWEAPPYTYVFLNNIFCSAVLGFLWLTIITLNYCNDDITLTK